MKLVLIYLAITVPTLLAAAYVAKFTPSNLSIMAFVCTLASVKIFLAFEKARLAKIEAAKKAAREKITN